MTKIEKLQHEVQQLTRAELFAFRNWFLEFDAEVWEGHLEDDARSGKLDKLAQKGLAQHKAGRTKEI